MMHSGLLAGVKDKTLLTNFVDKTLFLRLLHSAKLLSCPWGRDPWETCMTRAVRTQPAALYVL